MIDFQAIVDLLTGLFPNVTVIAGWVAEMLPGPTNAVSNFFLELSGGLAVVLTYFQFLDYFIDLRLYMAIVGFMLGCELMMLGPYLWRFLKSFVI